MTNLTKLPTWADKTHIHAAVETPRGSHCKLEFDPKHRAFILAKPLLAGLTYPYDWGFVPSTQAEDGDPLDILVIHDAGTYPGLILRCKPIGVLEVRRLRSWRNSSKLQMRLKTRSLNFWDGAARPTQSRRLSGYPGKQSVYRNERN
jgi:inorganic pyrophosphatase